MRTPFARAPQPFPLAYPYQASPSSLIASPIGYGDTSREAVTSPIKPKLNKGHKENLDNPRGEKAK